MELQFITYKNLLFTVHTSEHSSRLISSNLISLCPVNLLSSLKGIFYHTGLYIGGMISNKWD